MPSKPLPRRRGVKPLRPDVVRAYLALRGPQPKKPRMVYVAITVRDCEGEEFHGVFATAEAARGFFEGSADDKRIHWPKRARWIFDPKAEQWGVTVRGGNETFEVRRVRVQ